jgi:hypothetical protein
MLDQSRLGRASALAATICVGLGACGGASGPKLPAATRVCRGAQRAVQRLSGPTSVRIANRDPAHIECVLSAGALRVDVLTHASAYAWTEFDTLTAHQAQAYESPGTTAADRPEDLAGLGYNAAWVATDSKLLATNGSQTQGGNFVTVTLAGRTRPGVSKLSVAKATATATLAAAPRGPSPGPAPS